MNAVTPQEAAIRPNPEADRRRLAERLDMLSADLRSGELNETDVRSELWEMTRADAGQDFPTTYSLRELVDAFPTLRDPIIDGLIRRGEVGNVVSGSKIGKSWLMKGAAMSVVTGQDFLGFRTVQGRVLYVDNELAPETLSSRFRTVADAHGLRLSELSGLDVMSLRGRLVDLHGLERILRRSDGGYDLLICDALYRFLPAGTSENDNAHIAALYNLLDSMAREMDAAILLVHHSSKGSQSDKRTTDVGAGAGSQSRAADAHIVLREHEQGPEYAVLDAAVRSFAPVAPVTIRWEFPRWSLAEDVAPELKRQASLADLKQSKKDREGCEAIVKAFAKAGKHVLAARGLRTHTGIGPDRLTKLINQMLDSDRLKVHHTEDVGNGNTAIYYNLPAEQQEHVEDVSAA